MTWLTARELAGLPGMPRPNAVPGTSWSRSSVLSPTPWQRGRRRPRIRPGLLACSNPRRPGRARVICTSGSKAPTPGGAGTCGVLRAALRPCARTAAGPCPGRRPPSDHDKGLR
ncbi:hypothetical protein GO496_10785 [Acidovorax citrulli]|nr:hypothetical protein [Paracidovorax citrulli]